ncbi:unnamed protein product [Cutaneotrichosporon oleaginosum]
MSSSITRSDVRRFSHPDTGSLLQHVEAQCLIVLRQGLCSDRNSYEDLPHRTAKDNTLVRHPAAPEHQRSQGVKESRQPFARAARQSHGVA